MLDYNRLQETQLIKKIPWAFLGKTLNQFKKVIQATLKFKSSLKSRGKKAFRNYNWLYTL